MSTPILSEIVVPAVLISGAALLMLVIITKMSAVAVRYRHFQQERLELEMPLNAHGLAKLHIIQEQVLLLLRRQKVIAHSGGCCLASIALDVVASILLYIRALTQMTEQPAAIVCIVGLLFLLVAVVLLFVELLQEVRNFLSQQESVVTFEAMP
eukprot:TRINITY_DN12092_c0_g1_i1.p1 TRINITY_DN12092_c0_g1~~TRINITY_DN12092_c0_g1_i1.p1  ORF type:complete len:154 (+),score=31.86 TRINITY_DN12092_c0_g1_i1:227-688(+)